MKVTLTRITENPILAIEEAASSMASIGFSVILVNVTFISNTPYFFNYIL
jgi:hypothetical protein